jgi:hypothetical protein
VAKIAAVRATMIASRLCAGGGAARIEADAQEIGKRSPKKIG